MVSHDYQPVIIPRNKTDIRPPCTIPEFGRDLLVHYKEEHLISAELLLDLGVVLAQLEVLTVSAQEVHHQPEKDSCVKQTDYMSCNAVLTADYLVIGLPVMTLLMTRISWKCLKTMQKIFETTLLRIFLMIVGLGLTELCELEKVGAVVVLVAKNEVFEMAKLDRRLMEY